MSTYSLIIFIVSATVIQIPEWGNILLDCGEGTWGQLCRMFGTASSTHTPTTSSSLPQSPEKQTLGVDVFLRSLKLIYISHLHADHHLGLAKILAMRQALNPPPKDPVYLVGVRGVHLYLREVCDLEGLGIEGVDVDRGKGNGVVTILSPALHWNYSQVYTPQGMWGVGGTEEWLDSKTYVANLFFFVNRFLKIILTIDPADISLPSVVHSIYILSPPSTSATARAVMGVSSTARTGGVSSFRGILCLQNILCMLRKML